ncbi:cupin domain-containing protein [Jatrophihabitans sp.]|uniref:cupin domain-containing protein n=1 Tax=Jatrophihabitans sp. TaxID=1932789 RepID=UPI0030C707F0|nr:hypothetical protein [Jatrophihabitans sp.]
MHELERLSCVVAREVEGHVRFVDVVPEIRSVSNGFATSWLWALDSVPILPEAIGGQPEGARFPGPGGIKFGLVLLPARSDGDLTGGDQASAANMTITDAALGMHATDSLDLEIVISGRVVLELPDGDSRVLGPGESVVLAGVPHRWHNPFDEPCVYAAAILGARGASASA